MQDGQLGIFGRTISREFWTERKIAPKQIMVLRDFYFGLMWSFSLCARFWFWFWFRYYSAVPNSVLYNCATALLFKNFLCWHLEDPEWLSESWINGSRTNPSHDWNESINRSSFPQKNGARLRRLFPPTTDARSIFCRRREFFLPKI